jgi:hypothetical protein
MTLTTCYIRDLLRLLYCPTDAHPGDGRPVSIFTVYVVFRGGCTKYEALGSEERNGRGSLAQTMDATVHWP